MYRNPSRRVTSNASLNVSGSSFRGIHCLRPPRELDDNCKDLAEPQQWLRVTYGPNLAFSSVSMRIGFATLVSPISINRVGYQAVLVWTSLHLECWDVQVWNHCVARAQLSCDAVLSPEGVVSVNSSSTV